MKTQIRIASLSLLAVVCLMLAVTPALADTLYSNGPYDGNTAAWGIDHGNAVTNSFAGYAKIGDIKAIRIVYWDPSATDLLSTVDMSIGTTPFGTDEFSGTLTGITNTFLGINQYGYALYQAGAATYDIAAGQASYVTLSNACTTSGCDTNPISWDENSGPSTAYASGIGSIPSEAFTLEGTSGGGTTPEPSSMVLFGSGIIGVAGVLRRRLMG
jgi:PEP-CTERM motif